MKTAPFGGRSLIGVVLAVGVAGTGAWWWTQSAPESASTNATNTHEQLHDAAASPEQATAPPAIPADALFGGRTLGWWVDQVQIARDGATPEASSRLAALTRRAEANGLVIAPSQDHVEISPTEALQSLVLQRFQLTPVDAQAGDEAAAKLAREVEPQLRALTEEIRTLAAKDQKPRASAGEPRIILAPRPGRTAAIRIRFGAGAFHDRHLQGLTRTAQLAMLASNPSESYASLLLDIRRAGGRLEVETGVVDSAIMLEADARDFDALAARLVRLCLSPRITPNRLDTAKSRASADGSRESIDALTTIIARMAFSGEGFENDPRPDPDNAHLITAGDVERQLAGPLAPANATVVVAGAFDVKRMRAALARFTGGKSAPFERPKKNPAGTYAMLSAANVRLVAYPVSFQTSEEAAAAHVAAALIQERLHERCRSEGIAYSIAATPVHRRWMDFILVIVPFSTQARNDAGDRIVKEVDQLRAEGLDDAALLRNRRWVLEAIARTEREPALLAEALAGMDGLEWTGPDVADAALQLTPERLQAIVRPWLEADRSIQVDMSLNVLERPSPRRGGR